MSEQEDHGPSPKRQKVSSEEESLGSKSQQPSSTTIKKANEVFEFMRSKRLSIADFISAIPYVGGNGRRQEVIVQSLFQNEQVLMNLLFRKNYEVDFNPLCNVFRAKLVEELKQLQSKNDMFGKFKPNSSLDKNGLISKASTDLNIENFSIEALYKQAPILTKLFNELLSGNTDIELEQKNDLENQTNNRLILILSVLCYTRNKKTSTNLPVLFGLYLNSLGLTTKRGLQIFNKFGISVNQKSLNDILDDLGRLTTTTTEQTSPNTEAENLDSSTDSQQDHQSSTKSSNAPLVLPFTQNIINTTNDSYKGNSDVLKISDAKFSQLFDQFTNNTTDTDHIDPNISNEIRQVQK